MIQSSTTDFCRKALLVLGAFVGLQRVADAQTAQNALTSEETYAIARDAYLYAFPIVSMDVTMRQATNVPDTPVSYTHLTLPTILLV